MKARTSKVGRPRDSLYRSSPPIAISSDDDLQRFRLAKQVHRVPSKTVQLSRSEEERVQSIFEKHATVSLHDHTIVWPENPTHFVSYVKSGRWSIGYEGLAHSGLDAVFEGLLDGIGTIRALDPWDWDNVIHQIGMVRADIEHQDFAFVGIRARDIETAHRNSRIAVVLHLEGPPKIGQDLAKLDILYGLGVRCMGIAYSRGNEFGSGLADKMDGGLTDLGHEFVERLNRLGVAIDIAHAGDKTGMDAVEASRQPIFVTHAGARALWPSRRMKPDALVQALASKGGVFGIEAAPHTTLTRRNLRHSLESVMEHFQHVERLAGIDHVAMGPDTLFGDHVALHRAFSQHLSLKVAAEQGLPSFPRVEYVDGLENPSEFPNIVRWLVKHGYSDQEIAKAVGGNILKVLSRVWR